MPADPEEGLDSAGYLTTGVDLAKVCAPYDAVLTDVARSVVAALRQELHGLYLYGSVATGQAVPPDSDMDLLAIVTSDGAVEQCRELSLELATRYNSTVRDVAIGAGPLQDLLAPTEAARANRCFVKHYCVSVSGVDLRPDLPRCRPDRSLAREFVGDLDAMIAGFRRRLQESASPDAVEDVAVLTGRRLLLAAAVLYSFTDRTWTTARTSGARMIAQHHPEHAEQAHRVLAWITPPSTHEVDAGPVRPRPTREEVEVVLDELGVLVVGDVEHHLGPLGE